MNIKRLFLLMAGQMPNLVQNNSFETAGAGGADAFAVWSETASDGSNVRTTTAGEFKDGAAALKSTAGAAMATVIGQNITVIPGATYRLTFWTRGDGTSSGRYGIFDVTHSAFITNYTSTAVPGTTFVMITKDFTVPAGCVTAGIYLRCPALNAAWACFDLVTVRQK